MAVRVLEAEDNDMPRIMEVFSLAFQRNEPFADATWPSHWTPSGREQGAVRMLEIKKSDPHTTFIKAVDDNGTIMGFAKWNSYVNDKVNLSEKGHGSEKYWPDEEDLAFVREIVPEFLKDRQAAIDRTEGNVACLDILAIDPAYQRRGVGAKLVEWGLQRADELGIDAVVESSPFGKGLYAKHGLVFQRDVVLQTSDRFANRPRMGYAWFERPKKASS